MDDTDSFGTWPDEDRVVFVPAEDISAIESICGKMEQAQDELRKMAEEMLTDD